MNQKKGPSLSYHKTSDHKPSGHDFSEYDTSDKIVRAGWVVVSSSKIIRNGFLRIRDERILEVGAYSRSFTGSFNSDVQIIDLGPGILLPGLINCHTHLELSFLKGRIDASKGFRSWVKDLISIRNETPEETILASAIAALADSRDSGTSYVADISSLGLSSRIFSGSDASGIGFHEFLGGALDLPLDLPFSDSESIRYSFAAHAPHTTSPELMISLKKEANKRGLVFSIHLDESDDEREFITSGKGDWAEFLKSRGIDYSAWPVPSISPVAYAEKAGILDERTLCVHVCGASDEDLEIIRDNGSKTCLCPRSNMILHGLIPPLEKILSKGISPCLGTDSLASCPSLSILDEARFIFEKFKAIDPRRIFEMATINGASSLGVSGLYGTLEPGNKAFMIYSDSAPAAESEVFEDFFFSKDIEVL